MTKIIDIRFYGEWSRGRLFPRLHLSLVLAGIWLIGVAMTTWPSPVSADHGETLGSIAAGGRLYDNWSRELAKKSPKKLHPLYSPEGPHSREPAETWRCVVCHGWDYRGDEGAFRTGPDYTGIKGISGMAGASKEAILEVVASEKHGYAELFDEEALDDIAAFVSAGQIDMENHINLITRRIKGDPTGSAAVFSTVCSSCHGNDGTAMAEIPPIGDEVRLDPWKALHKMLNGHPGDEMPALRVFELQTVVDLLAYQQTLPSADVLTSILRGGKLYDDWGREINYRYPESLHPAYPEGRTVPPGTSSWRCVECHGWDYKGTAGVKGIARMAGAHPVMIMRTLRDEQHALPKALKYRDLWDLATFVSRGQVDMGEYIDQGTLRARTTGEVDHAYFSALCASCHGEKGTEIRTMPAIGRVANDNPWKALHKMLNGHPGEYMPAWQVALSPKAVKDILAKMQKLPERRR